SRAGPGTEGTIAVTGNWNNTGSTFSFSSVTGSFLLDGGTVTGGTMTTSANFGLAAGANTTNLTGGNYGRGFACDLNNPRIRLNAGTTVAGVRLHGLNCGVSFAPGAVVNFPITIDSDANIGIIGIDTVTAGSLTLGPSGSISAVGSWVG